jgi:sterol desaturase/sphingolipid hydroxylase (fatty acid hydroxylase superfamily)
MDNLIPPRDKLRPTIDYDWTYNIIPFIILVWLCYICTYLVFWSMYTHNFIRSNPARCNYLFYFFIIPSNHLLLRYLPIPV